MTEEFFVITCRATGEARYEPRGTVAPGAKAREVGPEFAVGITTRVPAEYRAATGMPAETFTVGERVVCRKYGGEYVGRVVHVGARGRVVAEFTTTGGAVRRAEGTEIRKATV